MSTGSDLLVDSFFIVKTWKQNLQDVFANVADRTLRRKIVRVGVVHPCDALIGSQNILHDVIQCLLHPDRKYYLLGGNVEPYHPANAQKSHLKVAQVHGLCIRVYTKHEDDYAE